MSFFFRRLAAEKSKKCFFQVQLSFSKYVLLAHIWLRLKSLILCVPVLSSSHIDFCKQGLRSCPPLKLPNLGEQRQKRLGFYIVYFLACPISCLFLHAREVPGLRQSQNIVFSLWLSLHRWAINFRLSFCHVFCRVLLRYGGELCS